MNHLLGWIAVNVGGFAAVEVVLFGFSWTLLAGAVGWVAGAALYHSAFLPWHQRNT